MNKFLIALLTLGTIVSTAAIANEAPKKCKLFRVEFSDNQKSNCKIKFGNLFQVALGSVDLSLTKIVSLEECKEAAKESFLELDKLDQKYDVAKVRHIDVNTCVKTSATIKR